MKRTWCKVLLACVAAAALIFAAGCSDGSSEDWSEIETEQGADAQSADAGAQNVGEQGAQGELLAITEDDVLELIQEIGQVAGTNSALVEYSYWDFPNATFIEDNVGLVAYVQWFRVQDFSISAPPRILHTRNYLRERGKVSTELLSVDLSEIDWDESIEGRTQTAKDGIGKRYITVTIEPAEGASAELPEELQAITIAFDSWTSAWRDT